MKKFLLLTILSAFTLQCSTIKEPNNPQVEKVVKPAKNDDGEWDLIVFDSQYDYFLNAVARPMNTYSLSYLKNKNTFLVNEWNSYYFSGKYRNIIESSIDYDPRENYGLKFEYKLYQVFAYTNWKYGLRLRNLGASER